MILETVKMAGILSEEVQRIMEKRFPKVFFSFIF